MGFYKLCKCGDCREAPSPSIFAGVLRMFLSTWRMSTLTSVSSAIFLSTMFLEVRSGTIALLRHRSQVWTRPWESSCRGLSLSIMLQWLFCFLITLGLWWAVIQKNKVICSACIVERTGWDRDAVALLWMSASPHRETGDSSPPLELWPDTLCLTFRCSTRQLVLCHEFLPVFLLLCPECLEIKDCYLFPIYTGHLFLSGCCNCVPKAWWVINHSNLFLIVFGGLRIQTQVSESWCVLGIFFLAHTQPFSFNVLKWYKDWASSLKPLW